MNSRVKDVMTKRAKTAGVTAAELMTAPAVTIGLQDSVAAAARRLYERRVKRLLVVDDAGRMVGIVNRGDVLSVFDRPDNLIRDELAEKIIARDFSLDPGAFDETVRTGIVTITGLVGSRAIAVRLRAMARGSWPTCGTGSISSPAGLAFS